MVEQAPFRLRAVHYDQGLWRLAEEFGWGERQKSAISERERAARAAHKASRTRQYQQATEESQPLSVAPGEEETHRLVRVCSLPNRPGAVIELRPELHQIRFDPPTRPGGPPQLTYPKETVTVGPAKRESGLLTWTVEWERNKLELYWDSEKSLSIVHSDRTFIVRLGR